MIDFDNLRPKRAPTRKEKALYFKWVKYLKNSRLSEDEIHQRAASAVINNRKVPDD